MDDDLVIVCVDDEAGKYLARRSHDRIDNGELGYISTVLLKTYDAVLADYLIYLNPNHYLPFPRGPCPDCDGMGENCETCEEAGMLVTDEVWGEA